MVKAQVIPPDQTWGAPPGSGLVPIGDTGFYRSPDEPADPQDCARWPSSPYCSWGFNPPFAPVPIGLGFGFYQTKCDLGVQINPVLGFIKLPPTQIVYRAPECRFPNAPPTYYPPDPTNSPKSFSKQCPGDNCAVLICGTFAWTYHQLIGEVTGYADPPDDLVPIIVTHPADATMNISCSFSNVHYDGLNLSFSYTESWDWSCSDAYVEHCELSDYYINPAEAQYRKGFSLSKSANYSIDCEDAGGFYPALSAGTFPLSFMTQNFAAPSSLWIGNRQTPIPNPLVISDEVVPNAGWASYSIVHEVMYLCPGGSPKRPPPPPRKPPPKECCMACCDDSLLKALYAKVVKLSNIVGVDEYPAKLPATLISEHEGFTDTVKPVPTVEIPNLTQLLGWKIQRLDEILGQWEIPIEVKAEHASEAGEIGMKLPNLAEAIAEIVGMCLQTAVNTESLVNICTRTLVETGSDKQQNFKAYMLAEAIAEYLGFKQKEADHKVHLTFTPGQANLTDLLKECEFGVTGIEYDDNRTQKEVFLELLQAAAITRAASFVKVAEGSGMAASILDRLKNTAKLNEKINDDAPDVTGLDEFSRFLQNAEDGFVAGQSPNFDPWGEPYATRPELIRLTGKPSEGEQQDFPAPSSPEPE